MSSAAELDWLQAGVARGNGPRHSRRADPAVDSESSSVASDDAHVHPDGDPIPEVLSQVIWKLLECLCSSWFS